MHIRFLFTLLFVSNFAFASADLGSKDYLKKFYEFPRASGLLKLYMVNIDDIPSEKKYKQQLHMRSQQLWKNGFVAVNKEGLPLRHDVDIIKSAKKITVEEKKVTKWKMKNSELANLDLKYVGVLNVTRNFVARVYLYKNAKVILSESLHDPKKGHIEFPIEMITEEVNGLPALVVPYITKERRMVALVNWLGDRVYYEMLWDQSNVDKIPYSQMMDLVKAIAKKSSYSIGKLVK